MQTVCDWMKLYKTNATKKVVSDSFSFDELWKARNYTARRNCYAQQYRLVWLNWFNATLILVLSALYCLAYTADNDSSCINVCETSSFKTYCRFIFPG